MITMDEYLIDDLIDLHFSVLKEIFKGSSFFDIQRHYSDEMRKLDYMNLAKNNNLLTFDDDNNLIGAYPVSPLKTSFKVSVEGIGECYCMCAIDALGIAYTFGKKTTIESKDSSTGQKIVITVDPETDSVQTAGTEYFVSYRDPDKVRNIALDQCPVINFYSDKNSVKDDTLVIFTFQEAIKHAKDIFSPEAFKKSFLEGFKAIPKENLI